MFFGEAVAESFEAFQRHWKDFAAIALAALLIMAAGFAVMFCGVFAMAALSSAGPAGETAGLIAVLVFHSAGGLLVLGACVWGPAVMTNAAMLIFNGQPVSFSAARKGISWSALAVAVLMIVLFVAITFGFGLLVVALTTSLLLPAIIHRDGEGGIGALKINIAQFGKHAADIIVLMLINMLINGVTSAVCGLPVLFVAMPMQALTTVFLYRKITGRQNVSFKYHPAH